MQVRQTNWLVIWVALLLLLAPCAYGQLQVGDETKLSLTGSASLGYNRTWDGTTSDSVTYGFDAQLTGSYHDPRFLSYTVSPYLNQSNLNSNFNSNTLATGVNAQANFLSDSKTPMQFTYVRDYNREGTFNVPGSVGSYETTSTGQAFSVNAGYLPEDWPSIRGTFVHSNSDYEVLGSPGIGSSHSNLFGLSSSYTLWDTNLNAAYTKSWVNSESPAFGAPDTFIGQDTIQDTFQFSANRRVFRIGNLSAAYSRAHIHGDYSTANVDSTFNSLASELDLNLTERLTVVGHANYSSNLSGQYFTNAIGGVNGQKGVAQGDAGTEAGSGAGQSVSYTSNYLNYGAYGSYRAMHDLMIVGGIDHRVQGQYGDSPDFTSTIMHTGATWTHQYWGGGLGASYGLSYSFAPVYSSENDPANPGKQKTTRTGTSSFVGNSATVSYGRQFGVWSTSVSGSYAHGLTKLLVGYTQTTYGATGSISRNVKYLSMSVHGSYSKSHVDALSLTDTYAASYGASFSHKGFGVSGSYGQSSGNALQVLGGIVPVPNPIGGTATDLLIQFHGESYGFGVSWRPKRRLNMSGTYTHADYTTINPLSGPLPVRSTSEQYFARAEYSFRQLFVYTGYNYVSQGYLTSTANPFKYNTYYFGVTRRFNFF